MIKAPRRRKRSYYSGSLAKPISWQPLLPVLADTPPEGCSAQTADFYRALVAQAKAQNFRQTLAELDALFHKIMLLCEHFGINTRPRPSGWTRDLALNLARRHEGLFAKGSNRTISEIFATFEIDPDQHEGDADLVLALALARKHVPGLTFSDPKPAQARLDTLQMTKVAVAAATVRHHLQQTGKVVSDRKVAEILQSTEQLSSIMPKLAADAIAEIVNNSGNDDRERTRPLSYTALRNYLRQMREAVPAVRAGSATAFQDQFVAEVLPLLHQLTWKSDASGAGQI